MENKNLPAGDWIMFADQWLMSSLAWAKRGNKRQTVAGLKEYDRMLEEAFK